MYAIVMILSGLGYGCGYEGYEDGKHYVGTYTPTREYGWVVEGEGIHLDSVLEKTNVQY